MPAGLFQTTGIPVAVLIIDRSREKGGANEARKDVLFIEASKEFKAGKKQNVLTEENADRIVKTCVERLEEEKRGFADDIKDVYAEAKGTGFDTKAVRTIIRLRKKDQAELQEEEAIIDLYKAALGMT